MINIGRYFVSLLLFLIQKCSLRSDPAVTQRCDERTAFSAYALIEQSDRVLTFALFLVCVTLPHIFQFGRNVCIGATVDCISRYLRL